MLVTVFGASGHVGQQVVRLLLAAGHEVTVFIHSSSPFGDDVRVVRGSAHDAVAVQAAIKGSDAVISTLGSWGTPTKDILSAAMRFAIPAMQQQGIQRIITLTGSAARAPQDATPGGGVTRKIFGLFMDDILNDGEAHLRQLTDSDLDWTTLRASIIRGNKASAYTLNNVLPKAWETISRHTVAQALVDQLERSDNLRQAPHIHAA